MTGSIYDSDGRMRVPEQSKARKAAPGEAVVINAAYCPGGHNMISLDHEVSGFPGILLRFRTAGGAGLVALSAKLGDPQKVVFEGTIEEGALAALSCPVCDAPLDVLGQCTCQPDAVQVMAYLYPRRDPYQAIAFCNSLTCDNSAVIRSGEAIKAHTDTPWQG